jgi:hypothetical protein
MSWLRIEGKVDYDMLMWVFGREYRRGGGGGWWRDWAATMLRCLKPREKCIWASLIVRIESMIQCGRRGGNRRQDEVRMAYI